MELKHLGLGEKVAIVTGASRGIGSAVSRELARHGCDLVLVARDRSALEIVACEIRSLGRQAIVLAGDLRLPDLPGKVIEAAMELGRIDILVNNAGATKRGDFLALTDADWEDGYALKVFGTVRMCRASWAQLKAARGSIINIGGAGGRTPDKPFTIGGSVNAAVMALTKALADLGLSEGVRVNLVNPGLVRSDRLDSRIVDTMKVNGIDRETAERRIIDQMNITHLGEPEEIAAIVAFILSDSGKLFHGALIDADAGYTKGL